MIESHPQSKNKGQAFAMSFTSELRENLPYIALDLPLSVYTQISSMLRPTWCPFTGIMKSN